MSSGPQVATSLIKGRAAIVVVDVERNRNPLHSGPRPHDREAKYPDNIPKPPDFILATHARRHGDEGIKHGAR